MTDRSSVALRTLGARATLLGPNNSLENVASWDLDNGCRCYVESEHLEYQFQRDSVDAPSPPDIIKPIAGPGRWKVQHSGGGAQGAQGSQGFQGAQGPLGNQGATGSGAQGAQGFQGAQGNQGFQGGGFQGAQGSGGPQGPGGGAQGAQGATGTQGFQGAPGTGAQGSQGASGQQGFQGSQGLQGAQGRQGAQGATGTGGVQGNQGAQGASGTAGTTGAQGNQGAQGAQGFQGGLGVQGAQGSQGGGFQGAQGFQGQTGQGGGAQGAQGATGTQGFQGAQGQGFQGAQGASGAVGAQGNQGSQGAQGAQGRQGNQGASGTAGTTGAQGNQGATGSTGAQGSQGATGTTGTTGAQGFQGSQGNTGGTGTTGAQGFQGSQGSQGRQGNTGNTGAQGGTGFQGAQGNQGAQGFQGSQGSQGLFGPLTQYFYVDSANAGAADGSIARPYASPAAALAAHTTGNITLAVCAASYGAITITGSRNVTIVGLCEPGDQTVIFGAITQTFSTTAGLTLTLQNITATSITDTSAVQANLSLIDTKVTGNTIGTGTGGTVLRASSEVAGPRANGMSLNAVGSFDQLYAGDTLIAAVVNGPNAGLANPYTFENCQIGSISTGPFLAYNTIFTGNVTASAGGTATNRAYACAFQGNFVATSPDTNTLYCEGCTVGADSGTTSNALGPWGTLVFRNTRFGPKSTGAITLDTALNGLQLDSVSERSLFSSTQGRGTCTSSANNFIALDEPEGNAVLLENSVFTLNFSIAPRFYMGISTISANRSYAIGLTGSQALEILPVDIYGTNGHTVTFTFNSATIKTVLSTDAPARYFFQASEDDAILVYTGKETFS